MIKYILLIIFSCIIVVAKLTTGFYSITLNPTYDLMLNIGAVVAVGFNLLVVMKGFDEMSKGQ